jgi:hypothetical protein
MVSDRSLDYALPWPENASPRDQTLKLFCSLFCFMHHKSYHGTIRNGTSCLTPSPEWQMS